MRRSRIGAAGLVGLLCALVGAVPAHAASIRSQQWYIDSLDVPAAQQISTGQGVTVGVVDGTGVDNTQPDLAGQLLEGTSFGVDSPKGWSSAAEAGHATGVAGLIAGKGTGGTGFLGIAPGAKILPVGLSNTPNAQQIALGVRWAVDHGATVVNISIAGNREPAPEEIDAIKYAISKDVVVVAGAGNHSKGNITVGSPARIPGVMAVSGVDKSALLWDGSATGPEVAISAPAKDMLVLTTKAAFPEGIADADGTSNAAPIVAGAAALIRAKYPKLNAASVINRLILTAKDQGKPGRDDQYGFGTVRIKDALTADVPAVDKNPLGEPGSSGSAVAPAASAGSPSDSSGSKSGPSAALIAGIVGGAVVVILLVVIVIVVASKGRKSQSAQAPFGAYPNQQPGFGMPGQQPGYGQQNPPGSYGQPGMPPQQSGMPPQGPHRQGNQPPTGYPYQ